MLINRLFNILESISPFLTVVLQQPFFLSCGRHRLRLSNLHGCRKSKPIIRQHEDRFTMNPIRKPTVIVEPSNKTDPRIKQ
ncbi:MAG: hypothetical protein BGO62_13710 [Thiobacillus sp. 65-1402]|nr:MAG: hypothetical protein BGO62_13710 [Thiobacillus sp. 65-1402]